jgi:hypothetical protein
VWVLYGLRQYLSRYLLRTGGFRARQLCKADTWIDHIAELREGENEKLSRETEPRFWYEIVQLRFLVDVKARHNPKWPLQGEQRNKMQKVHIMNTKKE